MKIALAVLIAATCAVLADAKAQPFNRSQVCDVLAAADAAVLADHLRVDLDFGNVRQGYNFEPGTYHCDTTSYPTHGGTAFPSYFSIGFSDDISEAMIGVEAMPDVGTTYVCLLRRSSARRWRWEAAKLGCSFNLAPFRRPSHSNDI